MENLIVYSGAHGSLPVSRVSSRARLLLLSAGVNLPERRGSLSVQPLNDADARTAVDRFPLGNDREAANLILMDAAAMCAYAPYRATIVATENPFCRAGELASALRLDTDDVRVRIHHALCNASKVVSLGRNVAASLQPFLPHKQRVLDFPPVPLVWGSADKQILTVIHPGSEELGTMVLAALSSALADWDFVRDLTDIFEMPWNAAVHIGPATSLEPGCRLRDCWAGNVPVFQIAGREGRRIRRPDRLLPLFVTEGTTGRLCEPVEALLSALRNFAADPDPVRETRLAVQNEADWPTAWASIASEILQ
jgi:hypothetical protein